jgi:hypothetical protein
LEVREVIDVSSFMPERKYLFGLDADGNKRECPIEGMEDVWVCVIPPTWKMDNERNQFLYDLRRKDTSTPLDLAQEEIWLTYGGTNMSLLVYAQDERGKPIWYEEGENLVPKTEVIEFDENGRLSRDEFVSVLSRVPSVIIDYWYERVLEVALQWGAFPRVGASEVDQG